MNTLDLFHNEKETLSFSAGDIIFQQGEPGQNMYVVKKGKVDIEIDGEKIMDLGEGELLGEMALIDDSPRSATAKAAEESELISIDEKRFKFLVQQTPFFSLHVMRILVERIRLMNFHVDKTV